MPVQHNSNLVGQTCSCAHAVFDANLHPRNGRDVAMQRDLAQVLFAGVIHNLVAVARHHVTKQIVKVCLVTFAIHVRNLVFTAHQIGVVPSALPTW